MVNFQKLTSLRNHKTTTVLPEWVHRSGVLDCRNEFLEFDGTLAMGRGVIERAYIKVLEQQNH
jgi:hypothetical protein